MPARESWRRMMAGEPGEPILVDLGTSTVTGVCGRGAPKLAERVGYVGHPVLQTLPLDDADVRGLGSDFVRTGFLFEPPDVVDDVFTDTVGTRWLVADASAAPLEHPLEDASYTEVARHPRPVWPTVVQVPTDASASRPLIVADAPCSGLIETCFGLRNSWQFMIDITENWRVANALLDWAVESVASAYETMLAALPVPPDVVLYGDDYGYQGGMFLSDEDFRTFVRPRLRTLFSRIRRATPAAINFHCCGAVAPILTDLADLGPELLNLQYDAKFMDLARVRAALPRSVILHGYTDLRALGVAVRARDQKAIAILTDELVRSAPVVAAPVDSLATEDDLLATATAAAFVHALSADDIGRLRRVGPDRAVLDAATARAIDTPQQHPVGTPPASVAAQHMATAHSSACAR